LRVKENKKQKQNILWGFSYCFLFFLKKKIKKYDFFFGVGRHRPGGGVVRAAGVRAAGGVVRDGGRVPQVHGLQPRHRVIARVQVAAG
jgi:hypothetical protein